MAKNVTARISVSLPSQLLHEFDKAVEALGYDRSKAIQAAIRSFLSERRELDREGGTSAGALVLLYDHKVRDLEHTLTDIQHRFESVIDSVMHIHLDEAHCLQIIAVRGKAREIRELARQLTAKRGVKQLKPITMRF